MTVVFRKLVWCFLEEGEPFWAVFNALLTLPSMPLELRVLFRTVDPNTLAIHVHTLVSAVF